jgi:hypothetical protein
MRALWKTSFGTRGDEADARTAFDHLQHELRGGETSKCFQGRLLLHPSMEVNEVVGGVLARAVQQSAGNVRLHAFTFASNHFHLLVWARGAALAGFMQYLRANLSRKVGRLVDWSGGFWERRYSAEPVLDDEALIGRGPGGASRAGTAPTYPAGASQAQPEAVGACLHASGAEGAARAVPGLRRGVPSGGGSVDARGLLSPLSAAGSAAIGSSMRRPSRGHRATLLCGKDSVQLGLSQSARHSLGAGRGGWTYSPARSFSVHEAWRSWGRGCLEQRKGRLGRNITPDRSTRACPEPPAVRERTP